MARRPGPRAAYWTLPEPSESAAVPFEEAVEETERLLVESVRLRLISDVPVGVLLSGGVDSALVCWAMRELNANIKAFTVRAPGDPSDESAEAAIPRALSGFPMKSWTCRTPIFPSTKLTDAFSEPFSCPSAQAMLWVSRAVKQRATVLLTGDGGDDVFLGYPSFRNAWVEQKLRSGCRLARRAALRAVGGSFQPAAQRGARKFHQLCDRRFRRPAALARRASILPTAVHSGR